MYSRSYYPDGERMSLPENYDGTAFLDRGNVEAEEPEAIASESEDKDTPVFKNTERHPDRQPSTYGSIPFLSGILGKGGMLGNLGLRMPNIGTEEILILATAAFLFFSKSGDRECALILLLLIFIN
jgi:hypothetical protein